MRPFKFKASLYAYVIAISMLNSTALMAQERLNELLHSTIKVGNGRMSYLLWDLYDATLYAPQGIWHENKPFILQLTYLREIESKKIADRSIEEIRNQGFTDEVKLATWHSQLRNIFPDVVKGTTLTGLFSDTGETVFFWDNEEIGSIEDPVFRQAFADIWLGEKTSAPDLRQALLGLP